MRPVAPIGSGTLDGETEGTDDDGSEDGSGEDAVPLDVAGAGVDVQATDSSSALAINLDADRTLRSAVGRTRRERSRELGELVLIHSPRAGCDVGVHLCR